MRGLNIKQQIDPKVEKEQKYNDLFAKLQEERATNLKSEDDRRRLPEETNVGFLGSHTDRGKREADWDYIPGDSFFENPNLAESRDDFANRLEETRAQQQGNWGRLSSGFGRLIPKIVSELGKGVGYIGGALPALATWDLDMMTENFIVEAFESLDESAKEAMPVYTRDAIENGGFWKKTLSSEFVANEGMDGLGFLVAAIGTGYGIGALNKGLNVSTKIAANIGKGKNVANAIDDGIITAGQTIFESASEMRGTEMELQQKFEALDRDDNGNYILEDGSVKSPEEVEEIIDQAGRTTFWTNNVLLTMPNYIQTKLLFGKGDDIGRSTFARLDDISSPEAIQKSIAKMAKNKESLIVGSKQGIKGMFTEAGQEWGQFAISHSESQRALNETDNTFFEGLVEGMIEGITSIEGQQSIFLGGVLGLGPGIIGGVKKVRADKKNRTGLSKILSENSEAFNETLKGVFKRTETGELELKDGKVEIDVNAFTELMNSTADDIELSQDFNLALYLKKPKQVKAAIVKAAFRKIAPYLKIEGGIEIWDQHTDTMVDQMEPEAISAMGFDSKDKYKEFLKDIGTTAKGAHNKIKDKGPSFYGINVSEFINKKEDKVKIGKALNQFIAEVEHNAVLYNVIQKQLGTEISTLNKEISDLTASIKLKDGEDIPSAAKRLNLNEQFEALNVERAQLEQVRNLINSNYAKFFNKAEQQKAFKDRIEELNTIEAAEAEENSPEREEAALTFFKNLRDKGYDVADDAKKTSDLVKKPIFLKDDEGNIFKVGNLKGKVSISNTETGEIENFSIEHIMKKFSKPENIITAEDFKEWSKNKTITRRNEQRLSKLNELITIRRRNIRDRKKKVYDLQKKLEVIEGELDFWLNTQADKDLSLDDIVEEIERLETVVKDIEFQIEYFQEELDKLQGIVIDLERFKRELVEVIADTDTPKHFSFGKELERLRDEINSGEYEKVIKIIKDDIISTEAILDELIYVRDKITDGLDDLYTAIINNKTLNDAIASLEGPVADQLLKDIQAKAPGAIVLGRRLGDLELKDLRYILGNPNVRYKALQSLKDNRGIQWKSYNLSQIELNRIKAEIKNVKKALNKLYRNKNIVNKYDNLLTAVNNLNFLNEKDISTQLRKDAGKSGLMSTTQEQTDNKEIVDYTSFKKYNPFSTITQIWNVVDKNGKKVIDGKNTNWKESAAWSKAMMNIPLSDLDMYSLRLVNNEQLESMGLIAPTDSPTALYSVLYHQGFPYKIDGGYVYAGIAETDTYFSEQSLLDGKYRINLSRNPIYINAKNKGVSKEKPFTYKEIPFYDLDSLEHYLQIELREKYKAERNKVLDMVNNGKEVYTSITDISKGHPADTNINSRNNPKEIYGEIEQIIIPDTNTYRKSNGKIVNVTPGMPHIVTKTGQIHRVYNKKIGSLPTEEKNAMIDTILRFMHLSLYTNNGNMKEKFPFGKGEIGIVGYSGSTGIMDLFINWGDKNDNSEWGILIQRSTAHNNELVIRFKYDGNLHVIPVKELVVDDKSKNPKTKTHVAPELLPLVEFLSTKYLNVHKNKLGKDTKYGFKMPNGWKLEKGKPIITYGVDKGGYNEFVLDNVVYTHVQKGQEDGIPTFVNQYAEYDLNNLEDKPNKVVKEEPVTPSPAEMDGPPPGFVPDLTIDTKEVDLKNESTKSVSEILKERIKENSHQDLNDLIPAKEEDKEICNTGDDSDIFGSGIASKIAGKKLL